MDNNATSMVRPSISVIIPVYNGENYLNKTIKNLEAQTFPNFELIFINDGSTDKTSQILKDFKKHSKLAVTILTQKNKGPGAARNAGLSRARGKYLALLDADDIYDPEFLEKLFTRAVETKADIVVCRANEFWPEFDRTVETPWTIETRFMPKRVQNQDNSCKTNRVVFSSSEITDDFFGAFVGWTWDKLFRTDYIRKSGLKFQELRSTDDAFFCFMALIHAKKISIINNVLVHHVKYLPAGQGGTVQSVSNSRESSWDNFHTALTAMKKQMKKWGIYSRFERDYKNFFLSFSLWHLTTLTGSAYFQLFNKLKNSWFKEELGKICKSDYFYSQYHHKLYLMLMQLDAEGFLFYIKGLAELKTFEFEWHNQNLQHDLKTEQRRMNALEDNNQVLSNRICELEEEVYNIKHSTAWKVGRAITIVPRKIKSLIQGDK